LKDQTDGYYDHLSHGGKSDKAYEANLDRQGAVIVLIRRLQEEKASLREQLRAAIAGQETLQKAMAGYKLFYDQLAVLHDCNDCRAKYSQKPCIYLPRPGEHARINCPLWTPVEEGKCSLPDGVTIKPDGVNELDPCVYKVEERYANVTVEVRRCVSCGNIDIAWERQENTEEVPCDGI